MRRCTQWALDQVDRPRFTESIVATLVLRYVRGRALRLLETSSLEPLPLQLRHLDMDLEHSLHDLVALIVGRR